MNIAIIGADKESVHTIEKAHSLGHKVYAVDQDPEAMGAHIADEHIRLDISHEQEVIEALRGRKIDLVCTTPLGRNLVTIGAVNDALNLPGISRECADLCTDKYAFHSKLLKLGLRNDYCYLVNRRRQAGLGRNDYPAIFKPRYGSHGRSVHYVEDEAAYGELVRSIWHLDEDPDEKAAEKEPRRPCPGRPETDPAEADGKADARESVDADAFRAGIKQTMESKRREASGEDDPADDYILEAALPGTEYAVDGVVEYCNYETILIRRKYLTPPPARQAVSYMTLMPGDNQRVELMISEYMSRLCEVLGLKDCMLHADICIRGRQVNCIEVSASPAGRHVYDELIPMATGVDIAEQYIRYMSGGAHNFQPFNMKRMYLGYFDMEKCFVHGIPSEEEIRDRLPAKVRLRKWECNIKLLDYMGVITDESSLLHRGCFIIEGADEHTLEDAADMIRASFDVK